MTEQEMLNETITQMVGSKTTVVFVEHGIAGNRGMPYYKDIVSGNWTPLSNREVSKAEGMRLLYIHVSGGKILHVKNMDGK